jgi:hypothetical protein
MQRKFQNRSQKNSRSCVPLSDRLSCVSRLHICTDTDTALHKQFWRIKNIVRSTFLIPTKLYISMSTVAALKNLQYPNIINYTFIDGKKFIERT